MLFQQFIINALIIEFISQISINVEKSYLKNSKMLRTN